MELGAAMLQHGSVPLPVADGRKPGRLHCLNSTPATARGFGSLGERLCAEGRLGAVWLAACWGVLLVGHGGIILIAIICWLDLQLCLLLLLGWRRRGWVRAAGVDV